VTRSNIYAGYYYFLSTEGEGREIGAKAIFEKTLAKVFQSQWKASSQIPKISVNSKHHQLIGSHLRPTIAHHLKTNGKNSHLVIENVFITFNNKTDS
jgi:hypothetical protein